MLDPRRLRRLSAEAAERLEQERQREIERRLHEEEARRRDLELRKRLERERARRAAAVASITEKLIAQAIRAAVQGGRTTDTQVASDLIEEASAEITLLGFATHVEVSSEWEAELRRRLRLLMSQLNDDPALMGHIEDLSEVANAVSVDLAELATGLDALVSDPAVSLDSGSETYIQSMLMPYLERDREEDTVHRLYVHWKPKDLTDEVMASLHQVPAWLLCTSGSGFLQKLNECGTADARVGRSKSTFRLQTLAAKPERWGQNTMTKFMHEGTAIGVTPFSIEVMQRAIKALGFSVVVSSDGDRQVFTICW